MSLGRTASEIVADAGAVTGGSAALGGTAGFVAWLLYEPIARTARRIRGDAHEGASRERLATFIAVCAGAGGVAGFLLWAIGEYELL